MKFKPLIGPGEAVINLRPGEYLSTPLRLFNRALMGENVYMSLVNGDNIIRAQNTADFFDELERFTDACGRKWAFSASIADRFTRPGTVFN